jgi:hypothetical protein
MHTLLSLMNSWKLLYSLASCYCPGKGAQEEGFQKQFTMVNNAMNKLSLFTLESAESCSRLFSLSKEMMY